jgi:copper chaperone
MTAATPEGNPMNDSSTRAYLVKGMTCGHCRVAVHEEVSEVPGVEAVEVDLDRGLLTVRGAGFGDEAVAEAVAEAGYELAGPA